MHTRAWPGCSEKKPFSGRNQKQNAAMLSPRPQPQAAGASTPSGVPAMPATLHMKRPTMATSATMTTASMP